MQSRAKKEFRTLESRVNVSHCPSHSGWCQNWSLLLMVVPVEIKSNQNLMVVWSGSEREVQPKKES